MDDELVADDPIAVVIGPIGAGVFATGGAALSTQVIEPLTLPIVQSPVPVGPMRSQPSLNLTIAKPSLTIYVPSRRPELAVFG